MAEKKLYVVVKRDGKVPTGHAISSVKPSAEDIGNLFEDTSIVSKHSDDEVDTEQTKEKFGFSLIDQSFERSMSMYRDAVLSTLRISPMISASMIATRIERLVQKYGARIDDLCLETTEVYELEHHTIGVVLRMNDDANSAIEGARYLPQIAVIGLISAYDAFLSDLLRVVFTVRPEVIFTSDRELKFSDLVAAKSIDAIKETIILDEIESVLRKSHHEQFAWLEKKFSMKLRENLDVWPDFIELCERRNLLTHTGGVVSEQYIKNCREHGKPSKSKIGEKLSVDFDYLVSAIEIVAELGAKLTHTLWRKFAEQERETADHSLNEYGMKLIQKGKHQTSARLLKFGVDQKKHSSELVRRMMVVNLANALKLGGNVVESHSVLDREDWSASTARFKVCVAAVKDDFSKVCELIALGPAITEISASDFRDWPAFKTSRKQDEVAEVFQKVYGEPLIKLTKIELIDPNANSLEDPGETEQTVH